MSSRGEICHRAKYLRESFVSGEIASVPGPDQTNPANWKQQWEILFGNAAAPINNFPTGQNVSAFPKKIESRRLNQLQRTMRKVRGKRGWRG
jgi:hypothetical protein